MANPAGRLNIRELVKRLDAAAGMFEQADFVRRRAADGLFERMLPMRLEADRILDLGCGTGEWQRRLARRFPGSRIVGADLSAAMLTEAARRRRWLSRPHLVRCDAAALPFRANSMDLVFANMLLPFASEPALILEETARVLRGEGLFVFSALGPDSFRELREAWQQVDGAHEHVRAFPDMHVIGDLMVQNRLRDPVVDVEYLEINYATAASLYRDLTASAARNSLGGRRRGLTTPAVFNRLEETLRATAGGDGFFVTIELVFGHGWGSEFQSRPGEYVIDPAQIGQRRR